MNEKIFALALLAFVVFSGCVRPNGTISGDLNEADLNSSDSLDCADDSANVSCFVDLPGLNAVGREEQADKNVRVEVFHFHSTRQCYSCIRLGELAEATVNEFFSEELGSGKIVFGHLNVDLEENKGLAEKYGASGSSLWIGTYVGNEFHKEHNTSVWYKLNKEGEFKSYLKGILEKRLEGELD